MKPTLKLVSLATLALTLACPAGFAQAPRTKLFSDFGWKAKVSPVVTPYREDGDSVLANVTFCSYLGIDPAALYDDTNGYVISGPNDVSFGGPFSIAFKFNTATAGHVKTIEVALSYFEGTKKARIGLYNDDGTGLPGTLISDKPVTNMPNFGTCCTLTKVSFGNPGVVVNAATQYWVVVTSDPTALDFAGVLGFVPGDVGANDGTGWVNQGGYTFLPAVRVKGTNP